jgi:NAD(P)-dependent dehydrogenase (short-subunit alcohol dehydrogenase family)
VIYGAGGGIGSAVARAFAAEGATVFLTGRQLGPVEVVAKKIAALGGSASAEEVDALDGGTPLVDLPVDGFLLPIVTHARTYFLIARSAAKRMIPNQSGVIMTVTSLLSRTGMRSSVATVRHRRRRRRSHVASRPSSPPRHSGGRAAPARNARDAHRL